MRNYKLIKVLLLVILSGVMVQSMSGYGPGVSGRAETIGAGNWQLGLFQPLRYGLADGQELSTHPLLFVKMPNLSYQRVWRSNDNSIFATRHSFLYPTPLLNALAKDGIGGMISPEFEMPAMVSLYQEALYTKKIKNVFITGRAGLGLGFSSEELDERTTIDLPLVFNRLAVYYANWQLRAGGDIDGSISEKWSYHADALFFLTPGIDEKIAFEHKLMASWHKSDRFKVSVGYKLAYGDYPFGSQWNLLPPKIPLLPVWVPLFDLVWTW